jgi:hypothetical protein
MMSCFNFFKENIPIPWLFQTNIFNIANKLIDPDTDFVVVLSCRVPDETLPLGAKSPGNSSDSERSVGGGTKRSNRNKTCKRRRNSCNKQ